VTTPPFCSAKVTVCSQKSSHLASKLALAHDNSDPATARAMPWHIALLSGVSPSSVVKGVQRRVSVVVVVEPHGGEKEMWV
jgi:hypothetical protein